MCRETYSIAITFFTVQTGERNIRLDPTNFYERSVPLLYYRACAYMAAGHANPLTSSLALLGAVGLSVRKSFDQRIDDGLMGRNNIKLFSSHFKQVRLHILNDKAPFSTHACHKQFSTEYNCVNVDDLH